MVENAPLPKLLRVWLAGAVISVGILFIFVVFQAARMSELSDLRAMDIAQIARNLATGQGYTTDFIRPLSMALAPRVQGHPELLHAPLQPALTSLLFRLFGTSNQAISWGSGIPFLLTLPLVYWLGLTAFSRKVGMLSVVVLATNAVALTVAVSGTEGALLGLLFTILCIVLVYHHNRSSRRLPLAAVASVLTAALYLTHFLWAVAFVPVLLLILFNTSGRQRVLNTTLFVAAFVLVLLPWLYRTYQVTGNPLSNPSAYEMIVNTRTFSGNLIY
ncbi:MAG: glycosyltransferase family 39 protein, partial [Armatimonadetes bacterium]|nr:glycosyltransferase family 39 protein [Armatimonadota bacterium]